jgi:tetratricopeptide (TPR) repeat protein/predicted Ser/Thr protein kinase
VCAGCGADMSGVAETVIAGGARPGSGSPPYKHTDPGTTSKTVSMVSLPGTLPEGWEIGSRYRVLRLLGEGGMGTVYLVHDSELNRDIALKLIRAPIAADPQLLERFKREVQLSSEITHPNVLRVYDLGESKGIRFLTMQFVRGEDLAELIRREGQLPLDKAGRFFRQICDGLAAAHEKGVLHRDLKPQNIMVDSENRVYVMDFGLAKAVDRSGMTQTGAVMGSPAYMSPEQVKGEKLDLRSDIYSLGIILYEMITGRKPYQEGSAYEIMIRRLKTPPTPAVKIRPDAPSYLLRILDRCLEIDKDLRYGSIQEIVRDLEENRVRTTLTYKVKRSKLLKPMLAALILVILAGAGLYLYRNLSQSGVQGGRAIGSTKAIPLLGIVPFENRTGDTGLDWCGEGIARLVADNLAQSPHIQVVSATRIQLLRKANPDAASLLKTMADGGIGLIVTGEILPGSSGMTLSARMSETKEGRDIASRRVDSLTRETLIRAADQISMAIKKGLNMPTAEGVDAYSADYASRNPAAYEAYITGLQAFVDYKYPEAEKAFTQALKAAPDYTMARYRLAHVLAATGKQEEAMQDIRQAISESSRLPDREQRYIRAAEMYFSRRYADAAKAYRDIISAYPYEIEARHLLAISLMDDKKPKEAIEPLKFIAQMEPETHSTWSMIGQAYLDSRDLNEAATAFRRYVELEPNSANAHHTMADVYRAQGEFDLAAEEYNKAIAVDPKFYFSQVSLGVLDVLRGRYDDADKRLSSVVTNDRAEARQRIDGAFELASLRRAQGRFSDSIKPLELLEKEIEKESIREALALSVRGLSKMESGDMSGAARLIEKSNEKSPGAPIRYLFARGSLELRQKKLDAARKTASAILQAAQSGSKPNPKAEKAAAYLNGMAFLAEGKLENAVAELSRAVAMEGTEYSIYRLGLARAYLAAKRLPEALAAAKQSAGPLDLVDPKLELELDRVRAVLVQAEINLAMSRKSEAAASTKQFLDIWHRADSRVADLVSAERIIRATQ